MVKNDKIAVVGAGLVGTVLAMHLKQLGFEVDVVDRSSDIRTVDFSGRSINLAMSTRGWKTLDALGIGAAIRQLGIPMDKRAIHKVGVSIKEQQYGMNGESIYSISRGELNQKLVSLAEDRGVRFLFDTPVFDVDLQNAILYTGAEEKAAWEPLPYDVIFGADGAYSKVRARMQRQRQFDYQQHYLSLGYKELTIAPLDGARHALDPNSFHIWPRESFMLIALPNLDGSFTCTIFMPFEGDVSFQSIQTEEELSHFFATYFPDVQELIPGLKIDFFKNPTNSLVTLKCYPWVYQDKVALIGDAAHAIVPFYGQGLNAGLEDVTELIRLIEQGTDNWGAVLKQYQEIRKPNADAIAILSDRNFEEMGSLTADPKFVLQKQIEARFTRLYPALWLPLYDRVTFSDGSYQEALELGDFQKNIMQQVMALEHIEERWDTPEVEQFMVAFFK